MDSISLAISSALLLVVPRVSVSDTKLKTPLLFLSSNLTPPKKAARAANRGTEWFSLIRTVMPLSSKTSFTLLSESNESWLSSFSRVLDEVLAISAIPFSLIVTFPVGRRNPAVRFGLLKYLLATRIMSSCVT